MKTTKVKAHRPFGGVLTKISIMLREQELSETNRCLAQPHKLSKKKLRKEQKLRDKKRLPFNSSLWLFNEQDMVPQKKRPLANLTKYLMPRPKKVIYTNKLFQLCFYKNTDDNEQGEN